jgi:hypothetical protein
MPDSPREIGIAQGSGGLHFKNSNIVHRVPHGGANPRDSAALNALFTVQPLTRENLRLRWSQRVSRLNISTTFR